MKDEEHRKRVDDSLEALSNNKEKGFGSLKRLLALGGSVLLIMLVVLLVLFGLNLFEDDDGPADAAATLRPTPTSTTAAPTPEDTVEPTASSFPSATLEMHGKVLEADGAPIVDDVYNDVAVLLGPKGVRVELQLDIEQLVDLDDLGSNPEASDVVCASITLDDGPWFKAKEGPDEQLHAKGPVRLQVGYTEDQCLNGPPDEVATRSGTVEVTIADDTSARGTVTIESGVLEFTAEPSGED